MILIYCCIIMNFYTIIASTINLINYVIIHDRILKRERCTVEKNRRVRNCGSQSQNAQWNKHLLSEAQRVPRSTLMHWAISGWSNFSEGNTGTKRVVVLMINWHFAFAFGEHYLWILLLDGNRCLLRGIFRQEKTAREESWRKERNHEKSIRREIYG